MEYRINSSLVRVKKISHPQGREMNITAHGLHQDSCTSPQFFFLLILPNVIKGNFKAWSINPYQHYLKEQTSISQAVPILLYAKYLHTLPHILFATYRTHRSHQTPFSEKAGAWLESVPRYTKAWWSKAFCKQEKRNQKTQHNHITLVPTLIYLLPEFHICSSNNYYSGTRDNVS